MKFRHAAAAITAMLVMNLATAQTAAPAKAATAPAAATSTAKPGANPATDPATPGMPKTETQSAPAIRSQMHRPSSGAHEISHSRK